MEMYRVTFVGDKMSRGLEIKNIKVDTHNCITSTTYLNYLKGQLDMFGMRVYENSLYIDIDRANDITDVHGIYRATRKYIEKQNKINDYINKL